MAPPVPGCRSAPWCPWALRRSRRAVGKAALRGSILQAGDGQARVAGRVTRIERGERVGDGARDDEVAKPLVVARHHVPRCIADARRRDHVLVSRVVLVPQRAVAEIPGVELPTFRRVREALLEPLTLPLPRD